MVRNRRRQARSRSLRLRVQRFRHDWRDAVAPRDGPCPRRGSAGAADDSAVALRRAGKHDTGQPAQTDIKRNHAGQHRQDTRRCQRGSLIDPHNAGMRMRPSQHISKSHPRQSDVVDEVSVSADKAAVLHAQDRGTDSSFPHDQRVAPASATSSEGASSLGATSLDRRLPTPNRSRAGVATRGGMPALLRQPGPFLTPRKKKKPPTIDGQGLFSRRTIRGASGVSSGVL